VQPHRWHTVGILCWLAFAMACTRPAPETTGASAADCDVLFAGGRIVDGSGAPAFHGDVCVRGDRIAEMGGLEGRNAPRRVDATGLVVAPGFIDLLGQSEFVIFLDNRAASKITQGITTEITGEGSQGSAAHPGARHLTLRRPFYDSHGVPEWSDLESYFAAFVKNGSAVNLGTFVTAGGIRDHVIGRTNRPATADELQSMERQVAEAMEMGAFGLSTSLQYVPDRYASTDELIALAKVAGRYGGSYITHQRSEADQIDASLDEVFRIAREARVPATIHHLKTAYKQNWGRMPQILARLEQARAEGLDVAADQYPYSAASNPLDANLPVWAREGGREALLVRLKDPAQRARIKADVLRSDRSWENQYLGSAGARGILIARLDNPRLHPYQGRTLDEIARTDRKDPLDVLMDLILEDTTTGAGIMFMMQEDDVRAALRHPLVALGTDTSSQATDGVTAGAFSHPRGWGSATRILGLYVREEGLLTLEEAIRKMTSLPAARVKLWDRGLVRPGLMADLVVFDPATVRARSTFANPRQYSEGMRYVMVNGELVVDDGRITEARPGRPLRGPGYRKPTTFSPSLRY
jgi:dihydroorotase/N-acyl-D-amino-acid deacylase